MSRTPAPPQPVESMTAAQLARRERVLDAVVELVAAGRLDDMGMKDVAERSGVALGTIYRYFSSKDHLAAAALLAWATRLEAPSAEVPSAETPSAETPSPGAGMADRLVAILRRAVRAYEREPSFARLLILAATSTDPYAGECYARLGSSVYDTLGSALDGLDPVDRRRVLDVVGAVWYQALTEWVRGRRTIADVYDQVESAARLVLQ